MICVDHTEMGGYLWRGGGGVEGKAEVRVMICVSKRSFGSCFITLAVILVSDFCFYDLFTRRVTKARVSDADRWCLLRMQD